MSQSMRDYITLGNMMLEVSSVFGLKCDSCNSYTTTFEDNKGEIELSREQKYRPRTKHLSIKFCIILEIISNEAHQRYSILKQMNNKPTSRQTH